MKNPKAQFGKIVSAGFSVGDFHSSFALARYKGDGVSFDTCLQDDGSGNTEVQLNHRRLSIYQVQ